MKAIGKVNVPQGKRKSIVESMVVKPLVLVGTVTTNRSFFSKHRGLYGSLEARQEWRINNIETLRIGIVSKAMQATSFTALLVV